MGSQGLARGLESQPRIPSSSTSQDSRNAIRTEACQGERDSRFPDIWFADSFEPHRFPIRFESDQTESRAGIQLFEFAGRTQRIGAQRASDPILNLGKPCGFPERLCGKISADRLQSQTECVNSGKFPVSQERVSLQRPQTSPTVASGQHLSGLNCGNGLIMKIA